MAALGREAGGRSPYVLEVAAAFVGAGTFAGRFELVCGVAGLLTCMFCCAAAFTGGAILMFGRAA